jgi:uncharacterized protein with ParB-like and HNH nuclease domain
MVDLSAIFGKPVHYVVPLYQRPYVWTREEQWAPLAVVLEQAFVGSEMIDARTVIDGQQRLTTLQLLIAAARSLAIGSRAPWPAADV